MGETLNSQPTPDSNLTDQRLGEFFAFVAQMAEDAEEGAGVMNPADLSSTFNYFLSAEKGHPVAPKPFETANQAAREAVQAEISKPGDPVNWSAWNKAFADGFAEAVPYVEELSYAEIAKQLHEEKQKVGSEANPTLEADLMDKIVAKLVKSGLNETGIMNTLLKVNEQHQLGFDEDEIINILDEAYQLREEQLLAAEIAEAESDDDEEVAPVAAEVLESQLPATTTGDEVVTTVVDPIDLPTDDDDAEPVAVEEPVLNPELDLSKLEVHELMDNIEKFVEEYAREHKNLIELFQDASVDESGTYANLLEHLSNAAAREAETNDRDLASIRRIIRTDLEFVFMQNTSPEELEAYKQKNIAEEIARNPLAASAPVSDHNIRWNNLESAWNDEVPPTVAADEVLIVAPTAEEASGGPVDMRPGYGVQAPHPFTGERIIDRDKERVIDVLPVAIADVEAHLRTAGNVRDLYGTRTNPNAAFKDIINRIENAAKREGRAADKIKTTVVEATNRIFDEVEKHATPDDRAAWKQEDAGREVASKRAAVTREFNRIDSMVEQLLKSDPANKKLPRMMLVETLYKRDRKAFTDNKNNKNKAFKDTIAFESYKMAIKDVISREMGLVTGSITPEQTAELSSRLIKEVSRIEAESAKATKNHKIGRWALRRVTNGHFGK
jgi:hypothetical protein